MVGAAVTARQIDTNLTRISHSDSLGQYLIANLPAGSYEVTVEQSGSIRKNSRTWFCGSVKSRP